MSALSLPPFLHAVRCKRTLIGGCPLPGGLFWSPPLPILHAVRWERMLLGGSPCGLLGVQGPPPPLHAMRWERTLLGGCSLILLLAQGFPPYLLGMPCTGSALCHSGGSPPSSGLGLRVVGARGLSPAPSIPRAVCACC